MSNFPANLLPGDKAVWRRGYFNSLIVTVQSITPTGRIKAVYKNGIGNDVVIVFQPNGYARGEDGRLYEYTQQVADDMERRDLVSKMSRVDFGLLSLEKLRKLDAVLEGE